MIPDLFERSQAPLIPSRQLLLRNLLVQARFFNVLRLRFGPQRFVFLLAVLLDDDPLLTDVDRQGPPKLLGLGKNRIGLK